MTHRRISLLLLCVLFSVATLASSLHPQPSASDVRIQNLDDSSELVIPQVFFAPYDNISDLYHELDLIKEVRDRRKSDPRKFNVTSNPYSIKYAVYNIIQDEIVSALIDAWKSDVHVQVLLDGDQMQPNRTWNTGWIEMVKAGFSYSNSQKGLNVSQQQNLNLVGIEFDSPRGLMHLKTRLFSFWNNDTDDIEEHLITGSFNPEDAALMNNETLLWIDDTTLIEQYKRKWYSVIEDRNLTNTFNTSSPLNVLFSPSHGTASPAKAIFDYIEQEKEAVFLSVYSFHDLSYRPSNRSRFYKTLQDLLAAKLNESIPVIVVTDEEQADQDQTHFVDRLRKMGIPVYKCTNPAGQFNAMHHKNAVFGVSVFRIVTDSGNWSQGSVGSAWSPAVNDESFLFIDCHNISSTSKAYHDCQGVGIRYLSNFLFLVRFYQPQVNNTGQPSYNTVLKGLIQQPNWKNVSVTFSVQLNTSLPSSQTLRLYGNFSFGTESHIKLHRQDKGALWQTKSPLLLPFGYPLTYYYGAVSNGTVVSMSSPDDVVIDPALNWYGQGSVGNMSIAFNDVTVLSVA